MLQAFFDVSMDEVCFTKAEKLENPHLLLPNEWGTPWVFDGGQTVRSVHKSFIDNRTFAAYNELDRPVILCWAAKDISAAMQVYMTLKAQQVQMSSSAYKHYQVFALLREDLQSWDMLKVRTKKTERKEFTEDKKNHHHAVVRPKTFRRLLFSPPHCKTPDQHFQPH